MPEQMDNSLCMMMKEDNYNYEKGKYTVIPFKWNEQQQTLIIDKQQGIYDGALKKHVFSIVWATKSNGNGTRFRLKQKQLVMWRKNNGS